MRFHCHRPLTSIACALLLAALAGCQGNGSVTTELSNSFAPPLVQGPEGLPSFPLDEVPLGEITRQISQDDNIQLGKDYWRAATDGTTVMGDTLSMSSTPGVPAWAIWRWGTFGVGILPLELILDLDTGGDEFWLLISDYTAGYWHLEGPVDASTTGFSYGMGVNYISDASYTYLALVVADGNSLTVNGLNLKSTTDVNPPAAPQDLTALNVRSTEITLGWTLNTEPDMYIYNIYSGPTPDFMPGGPDVVLQGQANKTEDQHTVKYLEPTTTYHFRITAADNAQNESPPSNTVTETTPAVDLPQPPSNLRVVDVSGSWADLEWDASPDPSLLHYDVYTGPTPDFELGEPGVEKRNKEPINLALTSWRMTGLTSNTQYHCRMLAYCLIGSSELTNTATFTTTDSIPPEPAFTFVPDFVQKGLETTFDPSSTTDTDTPLAELEFSWDFDGDDSVDQTTTGPDQVTHTYTERGPVTCKLTVSDGTPVETAQEIIVRHRYYYERTGPANGEAGTVKAVDTDPDSSRIAVLYDGPDDRQVKLYQNSGWQTISGSGITDDLVFDVALSDAGIHVLGVNVGVGQATWHVWDYSGGSWTSQQTGNLSFDVFAAIGFDMSPAGRTGVYLIYGNQAGQHTSYSLYVWHEQSGGGYRTDSATLILDGWPPVDIQRTDANTYALYDKTGVNLWTFADGSDSSQNLQSYTGGPTFLASGIDPDDDTRVFWATSMDNNRIYYGDNYGTANGGSQYYTAARAATGLLGVGLVGDNEGYFFWCDEDSSSTQRLYGYDTTASGGSGQEYEIVAGAGAADGGLGAHFEEGTSTGIYSVANEARDGQLLGRFLVGGSPERTDTIYDPSGGASVGTRHQAVAFADGKILGLAQQPYATALGGLATTAGAEYTTDNVGDNNWTIPIAACKTDALDEYFVGGYTESGVLILNRFSTGSTTGTQEAALGGTALEMAHLAHTAAGGALLLYVTSSVQGLAARSWNGTTWSAATSVYSGSQTIESFALAGKADGEWGTVLVDDGDNVRYVETTGGSWGGATVLSTEAVNGYAGVGLDYNNDGDAGIAVEREGSTPGIYLGIKPAGGSVSWNLIWDTNGTDSRNIFSFYHLATPIVTFYHNANPMDSTPINLLENFGGEWYQSVFPFQLHGSPIGAAQDPAGNIILTGYNPASSKYRAVVAILFE